MLHIEIIMHPSTFTCRATCVAKAALWLPDWLKRGCQSAPTASTTIQHSATHKPVWVKCLARGLNGRDSDGMQMQRTLCRAVGEQMLLCQIKLDLLQGGRRIDAGTWSYRLQKVWVCQRPPELKPCVTYSKGSTSDSGEATLRKGGKKKRDCPHDRARGSYVFSRHIASCRVILHLSI